VFNTNVNIVATIILTNQFI